MSQFSTSGYLLNINENACPHKDSGIAALFRIAKSENSLTVQQECGEMDYSILIQYIVHLKKKWTTHTHNMDETQKHV